MARKRIDSIKQAMQAGLKEQFIKGLAQGSKAVAAVIFEKANDQTKSVDERIEDILAFCARSLGQEEESK